MILRTVVRLTPSVEENALSDGNGSPSPSLEISSAASLKARLNTVSVFILAGTLYVYLSIKNSLTIAVASGLLWRRNGSSNTLFIAKYAERGCKEAAANFPSATTKDDHQGRNRHDRKRSDRERTPGFSQERGARLRRPDERRKRAARELRQRRVGRLPRPR